MRKEGDRLINRTHSSQIPTGCVGDAHAAACGFSAPPGLAS
jgi:hypothetical protein